MGMLLSLKGLQVNFFLHGQQIIAVESASLDIEAGQTVILAGESGSGKTVTSLSLTRVLPPNARIISGSAEFFGRDLFMLAENELEKVRGKEISYIFQEPSSCLNPVFTIGNQLVETLFFHQDISQTEAKAAGLGLLEMVKIKDPERVFQSYPHQLSGGMNQRAFIAIALACRPKLLVADEPTTALDVTTEVQILELLVNLKKKLGFSLLFITHNLSIARRIGQRIYIMHKGKVVESGTIEDIFQRPVHLHTRELIAAYEAIGRI